MANDKDFKVKNGIKPTAYHEAVGTVTSGVVGYSLSGASYDGVSFSVTAQELDPYSVFFKPDGTKLYVLGSSGDDVNEYSLSTAWNVSTASYSQNFSVATQDTVPVSVFFKPDGTKMYVLGITGDNLYEYDLSIAWDISTASYLQAFSVATQDTNPFGLFFKPDGTKVYIVGGDGDDVNEYSLSTAWNVSTASYVQNFSVATQTTSPRGLCFKPDGTKMYVIDAVSDAIAEYSISAAWDVSTASYIQSLSVSSQETNPWNIFFKPDGTKMYLLGNGSDAVHQYSTVQTTATLDLSTGSVFELTPTSDIQVTLSNPAASGTVSGATLLLDGVALDAYNLSTATYDTVSFSVASQDTSPNEVFFKVDGTKMYILGGTNDTVYEYNLSTAWDVSTSSYLQSFSVASQEAIPTGMFFKPDGTKMYIIGQQGDDVNEYNLSTAWSVSTASFVQSFSISSQDTDPYAVTFKPDGTKMYVVGGVGDDINEYDLSTAWDVSTASYVQAFSVATQDTTPISVDFGTDGTEMFVLGRANDTVYQYYLSTAWDVSTASYVKSFSVTSQEGSPNGLFFKSDGMAFYIVGALSDTVYQYSVGSTATITYPTSIQWAGGTAPTSPAIGDTDVLTFSTRDGGTTYNAALAIDGAQ